VGIAVETLTTLLTVAMRLLRTGPDFTPPVSLLKPLKGVDPQMYAGLISHCRQIYPAAFELLFGVHHLDDPAVVEVERLRAEFPEVPIRLVVCDERLGTSGKVST
jgi:ceramide glucosyltransferase